MATATRIAELEAALEELRQSNEELRRALKQAQTEAEDLRRKLGMNSLNSSLPPSRDDAEAKGKRREKGKSAKHARRREKESRRRNRSNCTLLPPDKVTSSQTMTTGSWCTRSGLLRQVPVLPRRDEGAAPPGGDHHEGRARAAVRSRPTPTRAFIVLLLVRFHLSRRDVIAFLSEIRGVSISLGLLSKIEKQCTKQLEEPYQEALETTQSAPVVHADETSWSYGGIPGWLWIATTGYVACFLIDDGRGSSAALRLLGPNGERVVVSDRWVAYGSYGRRQVCWSHLDRNAQALVERGGGAARVGNRVLEFIRKMFRLWHRFLDGELSRAGLRNRVKCLGRRMLEALSRMRRLPPVAHTFIRGLHRVEAHLFTNTLGRRRDPDQQ